MEIIQRVSETNSKRGSGHTSLEKSEPDPYPEWSLSFSTADAWAWAGFCMPVAQDLGSEKPS